MRQADEEVTRPPNTEADHLSTANNSQQIFSGGRGVQSREGWIGVNGVQGNHSSWPAEPIDHIDRFSRSLEATFLATPYFTPHAGVSPWTRGCLERE